MIKHLFKLIWNKKKVNALIVIEILASFLVLFAVVTIGVVSIERYNQPLGFTYADVWNIQIDSRLSFDSTNNGIKRQTMRQLLLTMQQLPEMEEVCGWACPPYSNSTSIRSSEVKGRKITTLIHHSSEQAKNVLGLHLVEGRWFEEGDKALSWIPVVINKQYQEERFGKDSALGKNPYSEERIPGNKAREHRVVGVIDDMRKGGEFSEPTNVCIEYFDIERTTQPMSSDLLIKVRPGTTAAFKEKLSRSMESVAKGWAFEIKTLEELRKADFKLRFTFIIVVGLIAAFLLLMVALGLIGVMWQNVTRRTQEIGLRRALGSTERNIYKQILGELLVLTTFGLLIGTIIIVQFPLLDIISFISIKVYTVSFLAATLMMYLLTLFCGLYPSLLAMEIEPAEALHYE